MCDARHIHKRKYLIYFIHNVYFTYNVLFGWDIRNYSIATIEILILCFYPTVLHYNGLTKTVRYRLCERPHRNRRFVNMRYPEFGVAEWVSERQRGYNDGVVWLRHVQRLICWHDNDDFMRNQLRVRKRNPGIFNAVDDLLLPLNRAEQQWNDVWERVEFSAWAADSGGEI